MTFTGNDTTQSSDSGFLNLSSPYHAAPSPQPQTPILHPNINFSSYIPSFFSRSAYHPIPHVQSHDETSDPPHSTPHKRRARHANRTLLASLALLISLSLTINAFLLAYLGGQRRYATIPHDAFAVSELGRNYTCHREQATQFYRVDRFERVDVAYDHYWRELLGGSDGYVYTQGRSGVREARFGMFHQLECLYQFRQALRAKEGKAKRKDFVVVGQEEEGEGGWKHCFDYLRQIVLCGADDTVEVSDGVGGGWESFGYGERQCRNPGWSYDITKCGRTGCKGGPFYHG
ncbi:hypothetical protein PMIN04_005908 [Paraphaeosphaeria minitans]|uniref:Uncharacterized protein n=1 Tax=Paraphaeosphaeria minitans TaxID=565426 RepID=A0A9P6G4Y1_9PLEO|nr:hypothetical protein PMIN01_12704 [Paraphaeosphaeria minitans]